jgi:hypothetical protein
MPRSRHLRGQGAPMTIALATVFVLGSFTLVMTAFFAVPAAD